MTNKEKTNIDQKREYTRPMMSEIEYVPEQLMASSCTFDSRPLEEGSATQEDSKHLMIEKDK